MRNVLWRSVLLLQTILEIQGTCIDQTTDCFTSTYDCYGVAGSCQTDTVCLGLAADGCELNSECRLFQTQDGDKCVNISVYCHATNAATGVCNEDYCKLQSEDCVRADCSDLTVQTCNNNHGCRWDSLTQLQSCVTNICLGKQEGECQETQECLYENTFCISRSKFCQYNGKDRRFLQEGHIRALGKDQCSALPGCRWNTNKSICLQTSCSNLDGQTCKDDPKCLILAGSCIANQCYGISEEPCKYKENCKWGAGACVVKCSFVPIQYNCQDQPNCQWVDLHNNGESFCEEACQIDSDGCTTPNICVKQVSQSGDEICFSKQEICKDKTRTDCDSTDICLWNNNQCLDNFCPLLTLYLCGQTQFCYYDSSPGVESCKRKPCIYFTEKQCNLEPLCVYKDTCLTIADHCAQKYRDYDCNQTSLRCKWKENKCQVRLCSDYDAYAQCAESVSCYWFTLKCIENPCPPLRVNNCEQNDRCVLIDGVCKPKTEKCSTLALSISGGCFGTPYCEWDTNIGTCVMNHCSQISDADGCQKELSCEYDFYGSKPQCLNHGCVVEFNWSQCMTNPRCTFDRAILPATCKSQANVCKQLNGNEDKCKANFLCRWDPDNISTQTCKAANCAYYKKEQLCMKNSACHFSDGKCQQNPCQHLSTVGADSPCLANDFCMVTDDSSICRLKPICGMAQNQEECEGIQDCIFESNFCIKEEKNPLKNDTEEQEEDEQEDTASDERLNYKGILVLSVLDVLIVLT